ncbi:MAG: LTA synthase family protein [Phycisphaerales bacterium]|jgi:glucan phosphoethanolaminetransferase (alkaline phosphatase superfamily)
MNSQCLQSGPKIKQVLLGHRLWDFLAPRAYSVIMFGALFCTLAVKFFHSWRYSLIDEYLGWVLGDISFLLGMEVILALFCFTWSRTWIVRTATVVAAVMCTWSVMNAAWLIRTGTQILPRVLLPLVRAPVNSLCIVGVNLAKMPIAAVVLLAPSAVALGFFFFLLANPKLPLYDRKHFLMRIAACLTIVFVAVVARPAVARRGSSQIGSVGLRYNSQLRAVISLLVPDYRRAPDPKRTIAYFDQLTIAVKPRQVKHNVVLVVLEGIQYQHTSLADRRGNLTPYLATLAGQGVEFSNTRSSLTHTTKALFALLTGCFASASQDIAEAVPVARPYASIATILGDNLDYRTAFFQSAMGSFESRPGLVHNLGFEKFWARDDLGDPNSFLGYLACDEFSILQPMAEWMQAEQRPFFLTVLCSVTHDPYEVPTWFATPAKEPVERYRQAIFYTDKFLAALDVQLANLNLTDKTILCVIGDHGEAFGEHGLLGHERIAFDEVLHVPFCLRAPFLAEPATKVTQPVSSVDLTPTLLGLLGFETDSVGFDGANVLGSVSDDRKVYFSGWMQEGPSGFVRGDRKFIYNPTDKTTCVYNLSADPLELVRIELPEEQANRIAAEIVAWRQRTVFRLDQQRTGKKLLFDHWVCRWTGRVSSAKYKKKEHK